MPPSSSKKKRPDDDSLPPDLTKPVQLQRRRVWRACECCRSVLFLTHFLSVHFLSSSFPTGAKKSSVTDASQLARSVLCQALNALGFKPKTVQL